MLENAYFPFKKKLYDIKMFVTMKEVCGFRVLNFNTNHVDFLLVLKLQIK